MERKHGIRRVGRAGFVCAAAGLVTPALAVDKSWNAGSGNWSVAGNWWLVGVPQAADRVFIGSRAGVENDWVTMDQHATCARVEVTDGMMLDFNAHILTVNGHALISGRNEIDTELGPFVYSSRMRIDNVVAGPELLTESLTIQDRARLEMEGGTVRAADFVHNDLNSWISGHGMFLMAGAGTTFINDGTMSPGADGGLYLTQLGDGLFDLDGVSGGGRVWMNTVAPRLVAVTGDGLADPFSGEIFLVHDAVLNMNLANGWTADAASRIRVSAGSEPNTAARIIGAPLLVAGELEVAGGEATLYLEADATFAATSVVTLGTDDTLRTIGDTVIQGGDFSLGEGSELRFQDQTVVHAGVFSTFSDSFLDGAVSFVGPTTWAGEVTFHGVVRQLGDATVSSATVIHADVFDLDGAAPHAWNVNANTVINAAALDLADNSVSGVINVNGGFAANLVINLDGPGESWAMAGEMNLTGTPLLVTRLAGSPVAIAGDLNVPSGRVNVQAPMTIAASAQVGFGAASALLRLNAESMVFPTASFVGDGTLQVGTGGTMIILSGAGLGGVGLSNQGTLHVGSLSGIAAVDRFENTGTWHVQIGGYAAGTGYDRLVVSGGAATVGGTLDVRVIDEDGDGVGFHPVPGDAFTILTAVGGVNSTLPAQVTSGANGLIYEWSVEVGSNDITLRLDDVHAPPCAADFNHDGVVNSQDFFDFLSAFFLLQPEANVNGDGVVNSQDFFDYLVVFFKGC